MINYIRSVDLRTFLSVFNYTRRTSLSSYARLVSRSADGWLYLSLPPLIMLLKPEKQTAYILLALIGFSVERTVYFFLKNTIRRKRPGQAIDGFQALIMAADEFSLPSGHTSAAFFFVGFLCFGLSMVFLPLYLWALAVGLSRVVLGVHFLTDIFAGAMIGTTIVLLMV
ncbi:MAG: phosphatase PAP2 family protein [Pseudomonadales bacterium]|nr:phosphatase PAP2 family protein [Pseudomonadales bacterium]